MRDARTSGTAIKRRSRRKIWPQGAIQSDVKPLQPCAAAHMPNKRPRTSPMMICQWSLRYQGMESGGMMVDSEKKTQERADMTASQDLNSSLTSFLSFMGRGMPSTTIKNQLDPSLRDIRSTGTARPSGSKAIPIDVSKRSFWILALTAASIPAIK